MARSGGGWHAFPGLVLCVTRVNWAARRPVHTAKVQDFVELAYSFVVNRRVLKPLRVCSQSVLNTLVRGPFGSFGAGKRPPV